MSKAKQKIRSAALTLGITVTASLLASTAQAQVRCPISYDDLKNAVTNAAAADSTGLNNNYWAVVTNRDGTVCSVAYSGPTIHSQWLLSRQIAAAKAFTANGLSLDAPKGPLSTAQLYGFVQPSPSGGNPLFGLGGGNVLDGGTVYDGDAADWGTARDPLIGKRVGGTITFGGGLAIYNGNIKVGGLGVSGDTACADHSVAWRIRTALKLTPPSQTDTITLTSGATPTTGGHPRCPNDAATQGQTATN